MSEALGLMAPAANAHQYLDSQSYLDCSESTAAKIDQEVQKLLTQALDSEDLAQLERLPGVGKKTAQKMMLALKGKLSFGDSPVPRPTATTSRWQDVVQALVDMGYDKRDCEAVLARLEQELAPELKNKAPSQQEELLFRRAIVELA